MPAKAKQVELVAHPLRKNVQIALTLWTTAPVCALFGVNQNTLGHWRDEKGFPVIIMPGNRRGILLYDPVAVLSWGVENGYEMHPEAASILHAASVRRIEESIP